MTQTQNNNILMDSQYNASQNIKFWWFSRVGSSYYFSK